MRIISAHDAQRFRTPDDLHLWVDRKIRGFASTKFGTRALRLRKHSYAKWLMEEIFPLSEFGILAFSGKSEVRLRPIRGGQPYDAEVQSSFALPYKRVEITHASQDREEHLRMVFLDKHGHVPMTGPIYSKRDARGNEEVEATLEAVSHNAAREAMPERVRDRIEKKCRKKYAPDVALLVAFSPIGKPTDDDRAAFSDFARSELQPFRDRFPEIFLVSTFGGYLSSVDELCSAA
jgi:hypothetical protein